MILENSLTKLQATIQFMKAKSKGPGNGAGVGKGKARGGKYYKREIVNGKLKYYYTREQYEKEHKEDKGKSESVISKFLSFFRVKPEQAFDVIEKNYEEAKPSTGVSLEEFTTYTIEYFNHKEEIDKKLQEALAKKQAPKEPKEKVEPQEAIEEDATEPKEKTPKEPREAKPKTVNAKTLVFKYWFNKMKGSQAQPTEPKETPRQEEVKKEATPTQATEDNFETMPEGESEKKQLRIREIENKINSYLRKIKNFKANSSLRPPSITIEIVKKWSSVIDKLTKEKDELLGKKSSEEYIMDNDDNHPHELPNHVLRNIENQIKKIHKEYFENEDKPKEKVNQNDLEFIKELPNDKIREALEKLDNEKLKKIRLDSDFRYKNNQNRNLQEKYLKIIVMSNEELLKRDIRLSYQEISNYSPTPSPVTVEKAVENLGKAKEAKKAPAFSLEDEDITMKEKQTKAEADQGALFGKQPIEKVTSSNYKPKLNIEGNPSSISDYITSVKNSLIKEGLDSKAQDFVNKAMKMGSLDDVKNLSDEYILRQKTSSALKIHNEASISVPLQKVMAEIKEATEKKAQKEEERLSENRDKYNDSFKTIPAEQIKTKDQYTSKNHFDRPVIEGIKQNILANGYNPSFPISVDSEGYVVDGHHRFTAVSELVKEGKLPANTPIPTITKQYTSEAERILDQVSANKMRRQVNPLDDARAYKELVDSGKSVSEISERTGDAPEKIRNLIALNNLVPELKDLVTSEHMSGRKRTGGNDDGTKEKVESVSHGVMMIIGKHGVDADGKPNGTIQRKAFRYALDNKGKVTSSQIASYMEGLKSQSFGFSGVDSSGRSKSEQEALRLVGDEDKAHAQASKAENFIKDTQRVFSKLFGDSTGDLDPKLMKELTASVMGTKGEGKAQNLHDHLDQLIKTLAQAKEHVKRNIGEVKANASMDDMFAMGKSSLYKTLYSLEIKARILKNSQPK